MIIKPQQTVKNSDKKYNCTQKYTFTPNKSSIFDLCKKLRNFNGILYQFRDRKWNLYQSVK